MGGVQLSVKCVCIIHHGQSSEAHSVSRLVAPAGDYSRQMLRLAATTA